MAATVCAHGGALKICPLRRLLSSAVRPPPPPLNREPRRSTIRAIRPSTADSSNVRPTRPSTADSYNGRPICPSISCSKNAWDRERLMLEEKKLRHKSLQQLRTESNDTQPSIGTPTANGNLEKNMCDPVKEQEKQEEYFRKLKAQEEKSRRRKEQEEDNRKLKEQDENIRKDKEDLVSHIYDKVLIVDKVKTAKQVVRLLTTKYKEFTFACDTEVADIDVKQETPVDHGKITCFSIYGGEGADFGEKKSGIWVDVLDGEKGVLLEFKPFFEDPNIKKVWHNYSLGSHVIEKYGIKLSGFHADTMHLARLWDSSRRTEGGYSLEALTRDPKVMSRDSLKNDAVSAENVSAAANISVGLMNKKISMKSIFGKEKLRADGSQGKLTTLAPVEMFQRGEERIPWICYSVLDSISTLMLFESLKEKLENAMVFP